MGITHFIFVGFDSINGNYSGISTYSYPENYKQQIEIQKRFLKNISHEYLNL